MNKPHFDSGRLSRGEVGWWRSIDGGIAKKESNQIRKRIQDRNFADASVAKTFDVGDGGVEGFFSYHSISVDDDERYAVFTNPADGEICLLSLDNLKVLGRQKVGGIPTGIIAVGGEASKH